MWHNLTRSFKFICLFALAMVAMACSTSGGGQRTKVKLAAASVSEKDGYKVVSGALTPAEPCTGPEENLYGPSGQSIVCVDGFKWANFAAEDCSFDDQGVATCELVPCGDNATCDNSSEKPGGTAGMCKANASSIAASGQGYCLFLYASCTASTGQCATEGQYQYVAGNWTCVPTSNPANKASDESCDGTDNDCDGLTDEDFMVGAACDGTDDDSCMGGTYQCDVGGGATCQGDSTNQTEVCDGSDNDCDGQIDETWPQLGQGCDGLDADLCTSNGEYVCAPGGATATCLDSGPVNVEICNGLDDNCDGTTDEGCDADGDGYCASVSGSSPACPNGGGDCNDNDPALKPGAVEKCDAVDNDCDSSVDEGFDLSGSCSAGMGVCQVTGGSKLCSGDGLSVVCSASANMAAMATEACNNLDDNCDGTTDEGCDDDGDDYCDASMTTTASAACPNGGGDCDDSVGAVHPAATEACNNLDDNCAGGTDEGCDDDNDNYCDANMVYTVSSTCTAGGDCDDDSLATRPGATESCDNVDNDCDSQIDEDGACPLACAWAVPLQCGVAYDFDQAANQFAAQIGTGASSYTCPSNFGDQTFSTAPYTNVELYFFVQLNAGQSADLTLAPDSSVASGQTARGLKLSDCAPMSGAYTTSQCLAPPVSFGKKSTGTITTNKVLGVARDQILAIEAPTGFKGKITPVCYSTP